MNTQQVIEWLRGFAALVWSWPQTQILVAAISLNFVLAVAASIKNGVFTLRELWTWLYKHLLPMTLAYAGLRVTLPTIAAPLGLDQALSTGVWLLIMASVAARVLSNLGELGVKLPGVLDGATGPRRLSMRQSERVSLSVEGFRIKE